MKKRVIILISLIIISLLLIYVTVYDLFFRFELAAEYKTVHAILNSIRYSNVLEIMWLLIAITVCVVLKDDLLYALFNIILGALWIYKPMRLFGYDFFLFAKTIYMILGFMLMTYGFILLIVKRNVGMAIRAVAFVVFPLLTLMYPYTFSLTIKSTLFSLIVVAPILWTGTIVLRRKNLANLFLSISYMALCILGLFTAYYCALSERSDPEQYDVNLIDLLPKGLMGILALEMMASLLLMEEGKKLHRVICLLPAIYAGIDSLKASGIKDESIARMIPNLRAAGIWLFIAITVVHIGLWIFELIKRKGKNNYEFTKL